MATEKATYARRMLKYYLSTAFEAGGLKWDSDHDAEVDALVDDLLDAAGQGQEKGLGARGVCMHTTLVSEVVTASNPHPEQRCAACNAVVIPGSGAGRFAPGAGLGEE